MIPFLTNGPARPRLTLALAHGAGAAMDSPFLQTMAEKIAGNGIRVVRFEFPYMQRRRESGKRGAPDPPAVLRKSWLEVVAHFGPEKLAIGGKSMGGRDREHGRRRSGSSRARLSRISVPSPGKARETAHGASGKALRHAALIVQGTRDPFGTKADVASYKLSRAIRVVWVEGGDHSLKPPAKAPRTEAECLSFAAETVKEFLQRA